MFLFSDDCCLLGLSTYSSHHLNSEQFSRWRDFQFTSSVVANFQVSYILYVIQLTCRKLLKLYNFQVFSICFIQRFIRITLIKFVIHFQICQLGRRIMMTASLQMGKTSLSNVLCMTQNHLMVRYQPWRTRDYWLPLIAIIIESTQTMRGITCKGPT